MSKLSLPQIGQLVDWKEAGRSHEWIARRLGITASGVYYHCLRAGIASRRSQGGAGNRFSEEEDASVISLRLGGATIAHIAKALSRPESSVFMRLQILAARDEAA